ncbi:hypothetical protein ES703_86461 [subsurface metagenome]
MTAPQSRYISSALDIYAYNTLRYELNIRGLYPHTLFIYTFGGCVYEYLTDFIVFKAS